MTKLKLGPFVDDDRSSSALNCLHLFIAISSRMECSWREPLAHKTDRTGQIDRADAGTIYGDRPGLCKGAADVVIDFPGDFAPSDFLCASARRFSNAWLRLCGDQRALKVIGSGSSRMGRNTTPGKDTCAAASLVNVMP